MSGHLRICFTAFLLLAGVWASPASSNPFEAVFSAGSSPVTASAPAEQECLLRPGKPPAKGQRWVYRHENHHKCWFETAEGAIIAKKAPHYQARKEHVAASMAKEIATSGGESIVDARAELLRSASPETPQPASPVSESEVAHVAAVSAQDAVALASSARGAATLAPTGQAPPDHPMPPQVDVEKLLAAGSAESGEVPASVRPATRVAARFADPGDNGSGWSVSWVGVLLMTLGLISLLSAAGAGATNGFRVRSSSHVLPRLRSRLAC